MLTPFLDEPSGKHGYRNEQGGIVVEPVYDSAEEMAHGLGLVQSGDHYGLVDQSGKIVLPVEFDTIYPQRNGWVQATKNKTEFLYNAQGELLLQLPGALYWYVPEEDGVIRVKMKSGWGALNLKGEVVIPFEFASLGPCRNGWLSFYENGKWGWLDKQGRVAVSPQHLEVGVWSEKYWWSRNENGYTLHDYDCKVLHQGWLKILEPANDMAAVKTPDGWKYIDENFNTLLQLPPLYEWVGYFHEGLAAVKQGDAWGFIDASGREVIRPAYQKATDFREGLAAVELNELWGFIDVNGSMVIPPQYRSAASFHNGQAWVRDAWCEWRIDKQGNDVTERKYWD